MAENQAQTPAGNEAPEHLKLENFVFRKIISGGQTGADRAGLDFAIEVGLQHGGFVPSGRRGEDGRIPQHYHLTELSSISYAVRTKRILAN